MCRCMYACQNLGSSRERIYRGPGVFRGRAGAALQRAPCDAHSSRARQDFGFRDVKGLEVQGLGGLGTLGCRILGFAGVLRIQEARLLEVQGVGFRDV